MVLVGGGSVTRAMRGAGDTDAGPIISPPSAAIAPRDPGAPRAPTPRASPVAARTTPTTADTNAMGTSHLSPALARALTAATVAASRDGVRIRVISGYRTAAHQQQLYEQAIRTYGSARLARRWVLPPAESAHVRGTAVDVGPQSAAAWLQAHGDTWGLCRRYDNEWWHFEVATAPGTHCPARAPHA